ncbi:MAG: carbon storage regulator CsrA [Pseudomonadota bacterium]|jgi:carbon storage regulator|nr:carbon storage regulator CsrA [Alphaproteobacteria bacterium]
MLSLSRKIGESIIINDDIVCTVLDINGRIVKLGFEYPRTASVLRKELYERIKQENKTAIADVEKVEVAITIPKKIRAGEKV